MKTIWKLALLSTIFLMCARPSNLFCQSKYQVTFFLSPTCKICQFYALPMREMHKKYNSEDFTFQAWMPGSLVNDSIANAFKIKYKIPFSVAPDTLYNHVSMNATITPQVFVTSADGEVLYQGRIDDSFFSLGKKRARTRNHELEDALQQLSVGKKPVIEKTQAVGCIIERDK